MGLKGARILTLIQVALLRWNQTKMGLKGGRFFGLDWADSGALKSDQDGIESDSRCAVFVYIFLFQLKSDQDGIERATYQNQAVQQLTVEIRPRWDWKFRWCPWARVQNPVEIRPRWDWKVCLSFLRRLPYLVEIRPRWDWKFSFQKAQRGAKYLVLKSDQDGIESRLLCLLTCIDNVLKSDQDGIESCKNCQFGVGIQIVVGWNQTKMGLKVEVVVEVENKLCVLKSDQDGIERTQRLAL